MEALQASDEADVTCHLRSGSLASARQADSNMRGPDIGIPWVFQPL